MGAFVHALRNNIGVCGILFSVALIFQAVSAASAQTCAVYDVDLKDGYEGPCLDGKAHGIGKAWGRGTYSGEFRNGKLHGKGVYRSETNVYEGDWRNGLRNGQGKEAWPKKGIAFTGAYKDEKAHGRGVQTFDAAATRKCVAERGAKNCVQKREGTFRNGIFVDGSEFMADGKVHTVSAAAAKQQAKGKSGSGGDITVGQALGIFNAVFGNPFKGGSGGGGGSSSGKGWGCRASSSEYINAHRNPYGVSHGYATMEQAKERAVAECRAQGGRNCLVSLASCNRE